MLRKNYKTDWEEHNIKLKHLRTIIICFACLKFICGFKIYFCFVIFSALLRFRDCGKAVAENHCGHSTAMFFERVLIDITGPLVRSACRGKKPPRKHGRTMHIHGKSAAIPTHHKAICVIVSALTALTFIFSQQMLTWANSFQNLKQTQWSKLVVSE